MRVYELLLWIDPHTNYAYCGCADVLAEPPAVARRFHEWLASKLAVAPSALRQRLDHLLRYILAERALLDSAIQRCIITSELDPKQHGWADSEVPELYHQILDALQPYLLVEPPASVLGMVGNRLRSYWATLQYREEIIDDIFAHALAEVVKAAVNERLWIAVGAKTNEIGGFYGSGPKDKATKVDVVIENANWPRPLLVNVKWSIRADREDQLWDDFNEYVRFDRDHRGFDHYLITNEFDPARLNAVCDRREANNFVFKNVVHINTDGVLAAYKTPAAIAQVVEKSQQASESSMERVSRQVEQGRLISLSGWLAAFAHG